MSKKITSIYRTIFKKSWKITFKNKFLWLFGLFAALAGNGGIYEIFAKGFDRISNQGDLLLGGENWWHFLDINQIEKMYEASPLFISMFWGIFFAVLVLSFVLICLSILSRGAIIGSTQKLTGRKKLTLSDGWKIGAKHFWSLFGLTIFSKAVIFGLLVLITMPVMFFITGGGNFTLSLILYVLSFILFTGLALVVSFVTIFAACFIVLDKKSLVGSISLSLRLFAKNWLTSIEMAILLFLISFGVGLVLIIFTILYLIPVILLLLAFTYLELVFGFWLILCLAVLFWLAIVLGIGAFLATFQLSSWTLLFVELKRKEKTWSKLLRFIGITK